MQSQSPPAGSKTWREAGSNSTCQGIILLKTSATPPPWSREQISPVPVQLWGAVVLGWSLVGCGDTAPVLASSILMVFPCSVLCLGRL